MYSHFYLEEVRHFDMSDRKNKRKISFDYCTTLLKMSIYWLNFPWWKGMLDIELIKKIYKNKPKKNPQSRIIVTLCLVQSVPPWVYSK